jgi:hypothetical protein
MTDLRTIGRSAAAAILAALLVAACSSAGAPGATASPPVTAPSSAPSGDASVPPDQPVTSSPSDGTGALPPDPGGRLVFPKPGQLDVHPVPADSLAARVDGSTIVVTATWTSGVEPCNVLDSILVAGKGTPTMTITLREGHGPEEIACIAIAEQHRTEFDIPDVAPGTYTIADSGGVAAPIEVKVG